MDHPSTATLKMQKKTSLRGYKVTLIKVAFEHIQAVYDLIRQPGVLDYLTLKKPSSTEEIRQYVVFLQNQWMLNSDFTWMLETLNPEMEDGGSVPIGQISMYDINFMHRRAEIG